jgi:hypothetical protein
MRRPTGYDASPRRRRRDTRLAPERRCKRRRRRAAPAACRAAVTVRYECASTATGAPPACARRRYPLGGNRSPRRLGYRARAARTAHFSTLPLALKMRFVLIFLLALVVAVLAKEKTNLPKVRHRQRGSGLRRGAAAAAAANAATGAAVRARRAGCHSSCSCSLACSALACLVHLASRGAGVPRSGATSTRLAVSGPRRARFMDPFDVARTRPFVRGTSCSRHTSPAPCPRHPPRSLPRPAGRPAAHRRQAPPREVRAEVQGGRQAGHALRRHAVRGRQQVRQLPRPRPDVLLHAGLRPGHQRCVAAVVGEGRAWVDRRGSREERADVCFRVLRTRSRRRSLLHPLPLALSPAGWDEGLTGMCEGEKRKLVIPSGKG